MRFAPFIALLGACHLHGFATAQPVGDYPARQVSIVVPYPIGSPNDIVARALAGRLAQAFKQPVTVKNRAGANGLIGSDYVAKAPPDGYTLLVSNANSLASGLVVHSKLPRDLLDEFAPVSILTDATIVLVVHASVPAQSVPELVALARKRSGGLNAALAGVGTIEHLLTAIFRQRTGIEIEIVPYKGGRSVVDLISGQADMSFIVLHAVREFIKTGRLRAIAVSGHARAELLPDVLTMGEAGYPDVVGAPWNAMLAPAGTSREIVTRLNAQVARIMRTDAMKYYLREKGTNALGSTSEEAHAFIREEIDRWTKVVKEAGVKAEQ